ncbi:MULTISPECIES: ferredoxin [Streptomycetaceae]|uniref:Ferredoxin n=1 Tax=Actinacidiphila glaucinigra TaxID=235986 RepID=A0A239NVR3_9ACTN|nr:MULTISPECIES: ferredoxin [Streptomycetaceae]MDX2847823.1 ferredoxin [Streptomyces sp. PA03-3a]MYX33142.1 ferredoxin [Streptomyces sp. SID8377]WSD64537.1 ferredoxin [Actinacidiphila glaucinigra]SNT58830.1 ferredoxin [Actinacidiphila glaucinigra]
MTWQIEVDRNTCIGTGSCAGIAPEHFELRDRKSCPRHPTAEPDELLVDAAESCPVEAITIRDATSGELIAPEP